jgi:hypothetical protein
MRSTPGIWHAQLPALRNAQGTGRSIFGGPNQRLSEQAKQVGDALANVGDAQGQPSLPFQRVSGVRSVRRMLLHLTSRKLAVHADRHSHDEIAVFRAGNVMQLSPLVGPILAPPKGARRLAGAFGAPFARGPSIFRAGP